MTSEGQGFKSTADAAVCVCGRGKGEHTAKPERGHVKGCRDSGCIAFRVENPRITNVELFNEYCEHPSKHGGF